MQEKGVKMFTRIKISNYKSLVKLDVDLTGKKNIAKPIILIYGENGVGKSNFASAFLTLIESLRTMSIRKSIQDIIDSRSEGDALNESFVKFLANNLRDTETIINSCKTINSKENMRLEYEFVLEGKRGAYTIEYDNTKIVLEKLEYVLNKNKTVLFEISEEQKKINDKLFLDKEYEREFRDLLNKYSGKHSFLSIILFEIDDKANGYVRERICSQLYEIIGFFMTMSIKVKSGNHGERGKMGLSHEILGRLEEGTVNISESEELDRAEEMLNEFFTIAYSDIKGVYYKRDINEEKIEYKLFFKKLLYGRIVDVDFELESTGTQHLLDIIPYILMSIKGEAVVIDELDTGIHDLLVNNILNNLIDSIKGQLIITTHNTMLLDSEIDPKYIYTFMVDKEAKKMLLPIAEYEDRIHPNLNYRSRYLKGMYGGVPLIGDIDFEELWDILE